MRIRTTHDFSTTLGTYSVPKHASYIRIAEKPSVWAIVTDYRRCASNGVYPVAIIREGCNKPVWRYVGRQEWARQLRQYVLSMKGMYPFVVEHIKNERGKMGEPTDKKVGAFMYNMRGKAIAAERYACGYMEERYITDGVVVGKRRLNHEGYAHERLGISVEVDVHIMDELDGDITELPSMDEMRCV